jgi:hypothetical protein
MTTRFARLTCSALTAAIMFIATSTHIHTPAQAQLMVVAVTPSPYAVMTSAPTTGTSSCGPVYSVAAPATPFYCTMLTLRGGGSMGLCSSGATAPLIFVGGGNAPSPVTNVYWANAGLGSQFLNVTWEVSGSTNSMWVTSLAPSAPFNLFVWC